MDIQRMANDYLDYDRRNDSTRRIQAWHTLAEAVGSYQKARKIIKTVREQNAAKIAVR